MQLSQHYSLKQAHTLRSSSQCRWFCSPSSKADVESLPLLADRHNVAIKVLGRGSNLIIDESLSDLVVRPANTGIKILKDTADSVVIDVQAGEDWHNLVLWSVEQGYSGLENLALIPGSVGAAPVQNIGAYGVELQSVVVSIEAFHLRDRIWKIFDNEECEFAYRDSVFKRHENEFLIYSVRLRLSKTLAPNLGYGPLQDLSETANLTAKLICQRVIDIRSAKLPDPNILPNAGSFFKNPVVSDDQLARLVAEFPSLVHFSQKKGAKLAAGWLIDQCGLKGQSDHVSGVGCYGKQALVLVNPRESSAEQVLKWAQFVQEAVLNQFDVMLEIEPRHWQ